MNNRMMQILLAAIVGAGLGAGAMTYGQNDRDDAQIEAYLLAHPEILPRVMERLEARTVATALTKHRKALETPYAGAWAGAAKPTATLVMFSDYRCGYCRASVSVIDRLLAEDKGLRVVWREIPILGPDSEQAAKAALNAATKGQYRAVHHSLFANGTSAVPPADTPAIAHEITTNLALARDLGISGTPSFVIGSRLLPGAVGYDALKKAIAAARAGRS